MPAADGEKSVEEIKAMLFADEEVGRRFLIWNILSLVS